MVRFAAAWQGHPGKALASCVAPTPSLARPAPRGPPAPGREGLAVSIRREDRERFEETLGRSDFRWVGETSWS